MNYVTETFAFIRIAVASGWSWFQQLLEAIGISWSIYLAVIVGFAVVGYVVTIAMSYFRGSDSADSVVSRGIGAYHHKQDIARHESYMKAYQARTDMYRDRNRKLLEYWNDRHFQKWKDG